MMMFTTLCDRTFFHFRTFFICRKSISRSDIVPGLYAQLQKLTELAQTHVRLKNFRNVLRQFLVVVQRGVRAARGQHVTDSAGLVSIIIDHASHEHAAAHMRMPWHASCAHTWCFVHLLAKPTSF